MTPLVEIDRKPSTAAVNGRLWGARAEDWAAIQERQCRSVYEEVFRRMHSMAGALHLDAGCGSGMAADRSSQLGARVSGVDAAENLLAIARRRVPTADFRRADLENLPFSDDAFDLVTGFNSFQYAANPIVALAEAKRVSRTGGRVVVTTWGRPEGMQAASLVAALKPLLPPAPTGAPGPFALSEETALRSFVERAGLRAQDVFDVDSPWSYPDLATALRGLKSAGAAVRALEHSGEEAVDAAHAAALAPFRQKDDSFRIGATFRCLVARS